MPSATTAVKKLIPVPIPLFGILVSNGKTNKTCHRDRIACLSVPCPSHKKLLRKNFNILLMPGELKMYFHKELQKLTKVFQIYFAIFYNIYYKDFSLSFSPTTTDHATSNTNTSSV